MCMSVCHFSLLVMIYARFILLMHCRILSFLLGRDELMIDPKRLAEIKRLNHWFLAVWWSVRSSAPVRIVLAPRWEEPCVIIGSCPNLSTPTREKRLCWFHFNYKDGDPVQVACQTWSRRSTGYLVHHHLLQRSSTFESRSSVYHLHTR